MTAIKSRLLIIVLAFVLAVSAFSAVQAITADDAQAYYEYSCNPWGGYTYHGHWNGIYHYTYYYSYYNEFWGYSPYKAAYDGDPWYYEGWDYCY